jgi:hypothetical protein
LTNYQCRTVTTILRNKWYQLLRLDSVTGRWKNEYVAPVEWQWQGVNWEKPISLPLCTPQISHGMTGDWTRTPVWETGD